MVKWELAYVVIQSECNLVRAVVGGRSQLSYNACRYMVILTLLSVHGQWGQWQEWNVCNTTCENGFQNRSRECDSPYPMFGGSECIGLNFDIQVCSQDPCPGKV